MTFRCDINGELKSDGMTDLRRRYQWATLQRNSVSDLRPDRNEGHGCT